MHDDPRDECGAHLAGRSWPGWSKRFHARLSGGQLVRRHFDIRSAPLRLSSLGGWNAVRVPAQRTRRDTGRRTESRGRRLVRPFAPPAWRSGRHPCPSAFRSPSGDKARWGRTSGTMKTGVDPLSRTGCLEERLNSTRRSVAMTAARLARAGCSDRVVSSCDRSPIRARIRAAFRRWSSDVGIATIPCCRKLAT
jgi:hypothetical protein